MTTFAIDTDNTITAYLTGDAIPEDHARFSSEKELTKLAANWPSERLAEVWNSFAGVPPFGDLKPVKKFTDRKTAVARIWKAVQALTPTAAPQAADVAAKAAKPRKARTKEKDAVPAREGSKKAQVLELLRRPEGASLKEIADATQWQSHSIRGFISGALGKKMGLTVESFKTESGDRVYRIKVQ
jgi:ribosomal protein L7/L12